MHPDSYRYRGCLIFKSTMLAHFFLAAALVCAGIYPGMILCESLSYDMVGITTVGCLARLCHLALG